MPGPLASVPLLALAAIAACTVALARANARGGAARAEKSLGAARLAWLAVPLVALAAAALWCGSGLYRGGAGELLALDLAALLSAAVTLGRGPLPEPLASRLSGLGSRLQRHGAAGAGRARAGSAGAGARGALLSLALLAACAALGFLALELPYNEGLAAMGAGPVLLEMGLVAGILLFLLLLFQGRGAGLALGVALLWVAGLAQYFVLSFKGTAILPSDLLALDTAATVSGSYVYAVDGAVVLGLACVLLAAAFAQLKRPLDIAPSRGRRFAARARAAAAAAALALLAGAMGLPDYERDLGVDLNYWNMIESYRRHGMLTSFVAVFRDMPVEVPEGYADASARELEDAYVAEYDATRGASPERAAAEEQFAYTRPSVICIMNESFSDLSVYEGPTWGYAGAENFWSVSTALARGTADVSVMGAGTCNSEFEFLTGVSMAYVGDGKYPYLLYDLSEAPSLARQFSALGYETTAIHPNLATNWNRESVFEQLGFDEFVDSDEFQESPWYHSGRTDASTYDKILEILRESDDPQFVFDITMQNHSSYTQGNIPADQLRNYAPEGLDESTTAQLNEYLACIDASDRDLRYFVEQLSQLDRPVILLFFGDHQPGITPEIVETFYPGTDDLTQAALCYQSTYALWANYPIASGTYAEDGSVVPAETVWDYTSPAYLAAMMLDVSGAPLTELQKAQLALRDDLPALSIVGTRLADGSWIEADDSRHMPDAYDDLAQITYLEFARKVE